MAKAKCRKCGKRGKHTLTCSVNARSRTLNPTHKTTADMTARDVLEYVRKLALSADPLPDVPDEHKPTR